MKCSSDYYEECDHCAYQEGDPFDLCNICEDADQFEYADEESSGQMGPEHRVLWLEVA